MSIIVLISGNGSNLQYLIDYNIPIKLVISNKKHAYGLIRAKKANIPAIYLPYYKKTDRIKYDLEITDTINSYNPSLIVLAGFMHILSKEGINNLNSPIINLHPALPKTYDGINAIERAWNDIRCGKINKTGVMVHYVSPEVDRGQVIKTEEIIVDQNIELEELKHRIHEIEHKILYDVVLKLIGKKN